MTHRDYQPGSEWRVLKACTLEGRRFEHVPFERGWFVPWKRTLKAGDTITCLGIKRHHEGVPAVLWQGEAEDVVMKESMGMWASFVPLPGYVRKVKG